MKELNMENANDHPFKVSVVKDAEFFANSHPYKVTIEGGGGNEGRVVDELPEEGEPGYIYLVLKESSPEGDIYDEYMWVLLQDGETHGWEHIGATNEVKTGAAKVLTDKDYNWNSTTKTAVEPFNSVALWLLDSGMYSVPENFPAYTHLLGGSPQAFNNGLAIVSSDETYSGAGVTSMITLHYSNTYPAHISGQTFTPYMYSVGKTSGEGHKATLLNSSACRNDLTSTSDALPLAANQGKVLKEMVDGVDKKIGQARDLTTADYNWPVDNPTGVAVWLLDAGIYTRAEGVKVWRGNNASLSNYYNTILVPRNDLAWNMYIAFGMEDHPYNSNRPITWTTSKNYGATNDSQYLLDATTVVNNLTTSSAGSYGPQVLDARQGKILNDNIGDLTTLTTTVKTSTVAAINELVTTIGNIETALNIINNGSES